MFFLPAATMAAEPLKLASAEPASKRFFPLDAAREKQNGIIIVREKKSFPLRSDRQQLENGFLRIDRARSTAITPQHALPTHAAGTTGKSFEDASRAAKQVSVSEQDVDALDGDSEEIVGNREAVNPVLALYDSDVVDSNASFLDVMRGRKSLSGYVRHAFWPIPLTARQYVSSGYGMRTDPFSGRPAFHGGIDIAADSGTPVLATADGTVSQVAQDVRFGKYISVQHADGTTSRYGHLSGQSVRIGQRVRAGQVIGAVGATGRATGPHLDYRVSKNDTKFDPLAVITVPANVAFNASRPSQPAAATVTSGARIATNALPKRPMVIQVK